MTIIQQSEVERVDELWMF